MTFPLSRGRVHAAVLLAALGSPLGFPAARAQGELPGAANQPPAPPSGSTAETIVPEPPTASPPPSTAAEEAAAARMGAPVPPEVEPVREPPAPEVALEPESERRRLFYLEVTAAYTWINLAQFRQDNLVSDVTHVDGNGYGFAGGAGIQVAFLTLGLQGVWSRYPTFDLGTIGLDVGFRLPVPVVNPYFRLGVGYAFLRNLEAPELDQSIDGVTGLSANAGLGLDIPVNDLLAINVGFDAAVLHVRRDPMTLAADLSDWTPSSDGEAVGLQLTLHAGINLRF